MLKKSFILLFIFICCGNSETIETNTIITDDALNSVSSNSSLDTTTSTLFDQYTVSSILKVSPTGDTTTTSVPQPIIGETTTTTVPQTTTTTVPQTTTTTVPQTTTTTVPQTTTTTTVPQTTTTTVPQTTTTTTVPQTTTTTSTTVPQTTINIGVTVANNGLGSNVYFLDGTKDATLNVTIGNRYRFDLSDSSNSGHPLRFSTTQNGNEYNSNVVVNGIAGTTGAYIEIEITSNTPNQLYIYCTNHFGMGGNTEILTP